jgi:hypothetical protein
MNAPYDFGWHLRHRDRNVFSASRIVDLLMPMLSIRSVVDFGCGDGIWLRTFGERGVARLLGYDGDWSDPDELQIDRDCFRPIDLAGRVPAPEAFDLAMCLEVGEHLPESASSVLLRSICDHAPVVLFGAAIPRQGGYRHINERWQSYWAEAFQDRGYSRFDFIRSQIWDDPDVHFWYKQNLAVFVCDSRRDLSDRLQSAIVARGYAPMPLDVVHPDLFGPISEYDQIAFKPLLRKLAPALIWKARTMARAGLRGAAELFDRKTPGSGSL